MNDLEDDGSDQDIIDFYIKEIKSRYKNFTDEKIANMVNLDQESKSKSRKEQPYLRAILYGDSEESQCAICQKIIPVNLMVAAHIKPRSKCSLSERKNINIVMPVCKIGCDDFFEKGYIIVNDSGVIGINPKLNCTDDVRLIIDTLEGNVCTYFSEDTSDFFRYKVKLVTMN